MREYAQERLDKSGDGDAPAHSILPIISLFAEAAGPEVLAGAKEVLLVVLEQENFLAAHATCDHREAGPSWVEAGPRIETLLDGSRGLELGYRVTVEALMRAPAQEGSLIRCKGLLSANTFAFGMGHYEIAQAHCEESLSIARKIAADERVCAVTLMALALAFTAQGKRPEARQHLQEALVLARRLTDKRILSEVLTNLAELRRLEGHPDDAEPLLEEALNLARASGAMLLSAIIILNLAALSVDQGAGDRARGMLLEALAIVSRARLQGNGNRSP